jgi:hypothetical protein
MKHLVVDEEEPFLLKDRSQNQIRDQDLRFAVGSEAWPRGIRRHRPPQRPFTSPVGGDNLDVQLCQRTAELRHARTIFGLRFVHAETVCLSE